MEKTIFKAKERANGQFINNPIKMAVWGNLGAYLGFYVALTTTERRI